MKKIFIGALLAVIIVALIAFFLLKESDPRAVCNNLAEDEICVCTQDDPTSACGIEKLKR